MKIGIVGFGFMGATHLNAWRNIENANVVAICTRNPNIGKAKQGNIETGSDALNLKGVTIYTDLEEMLETESLDAISNTLPTHLHKEITIQCLQAGLHVLCEKPMALNLADCQSMTAAAEAAGKELMIAHCIRFWPEYAWLKDTADAGAYGKACAAEFQRLTYAPEWSDDSWFADSSKSGGIALDLLIHDLDFIQYMFGKPEGIESRKGQLGNGETGHIQSWLSYSDGLTVSATASWLMPRSFGFKMSFTVVFEKGAAIFDGKKLKIYTDTGEPFEPELPVGDGYQRQVAHFAERIRGLTEKEIISSQQATESVRMALETENS
jgi:predicted dehydrogenase